MSFCNRFFAAAAACTVVIAAIQSNLAAQQTTKDGVRVENAVNTPERPLPAGWVFGPARPRPARGEWIEQARTAPGLRSSAWWLGWRAVFVRHERAGHHRPGCRTATSNL